LSIGDFEKTTPKKPSDFAWLLKIGDDNRTKNCFTNPFESRQNLPQVTLNGSPALPLLGITKRNFLKAHAIPPVGAADMEMAIDNHLRRKTQMPIGGPAGATPEGKARNAGQNGQILPEGKMIDEDQRRTRHRL